MNLSMTFSIVSTRITEIIEIVDLMKIYRNDIKKFISCIFYSEKLAYYRVGE